MALGTFLAAIGMVLTVFSPPVASQSQVDDSNTVRILTVSGLIDPVVNDFLIREIEAADRDGVLALVLQFDSEDSVLERPDFIALATKIRDADTQVVIWVGPSGAAALGGSAELLGVADLVGVAAGSKIGETGPSQLPSQDFAPAFGDATARLEDNPIGAQEAIDLGISEGPLSTVSTLGPFLTYIDGYETTLVDGGTQAVTQNEFRQISLTGQLFHTVASPELAYLFFVGGLALLVFELYTAGVGLAGVIGVGLLTLGSYGLAVLPTRPWAIALLILSFLAMAVDVQTNIPRFYSVLGVALFIVGTWFLYDGVTMSWITGLVGIVGAILYAFTGMPSMVRTRFSTPTIGRTWMIGEIGEAVTDVDPEGTVMVQTASWRAITNRATPVRAGEPVRVIGIDHLRLEIEPEVGGAKDYRDRH